VEKSFARNLGGLIRVRIGMLDRLMKAKREPVSDIDTAAADGLKVLDPKWPIREADMNRPLRPGQLVENEARS
jgi:hypothetical protein